MIDRLFAERELAEEAADRWWMFLVTGIGWLVFALLVFQRDYTTIYAISILFGIVALVAGANEFFQIMVSSTGWKIVHGILGVLFVITGIWALVDPRSAFTTLAALVAFFLLFKGIFDLTVAFMTKDEFDLWWLQLILGIVEIVLAFWVAGSFRQSAILLVVYVGVIALARDHRALPRVPLRGLAKAARGGLSVQAQTRRGIASFCSRPLATSARATTAPKTNPPTWAKNATPPPCALDSKRPKFASNNW